jgi:thioredoxin 1
MSNVLNITSENFENEVTRAGQPVLLDFWASWCMPCRMVAPVVEQLASELAGKIKVAKVNVDENPALAQAFGVMSIPTLTLIQGKDVLMRTVGAQPKQVLKQQILDSLSKQASA